MTETTYGGAQDLLVELTADIVAAYVSHHVVPVTELPGLISDVHTALSGTSTPTVDRKSTRLNSSHCTPSRMPSSA